AGGLLAPLSPPTVASGRLSQGGAVSPDGQSVYVANTSGNSISQYDVKTDGTLSPKSPPTVAASPSPSGGIAVSPDGQSVYVVVYGGGPGGASLAHYDGRHGG